MTIVTVYAAFISTFALLWQIYIWTKNRYKLSLMVSCQLNYSKGIDFPPIKEIICRIINIGREPVILLSVGFECDRRNLSENSTLITYETYNEAEGKSNPIVLHQAEWYEYRLPSSVLDIGCVRAWAKNVKGKMFKSVWFDEK